MSNFVFLCLLTGLAFAGIAIYRIINDWETVSETIDCFPENIRALAAWHKRRALRRWYRFLNWLGGKTA